MSDFSCNIWCFAFLYNHQSSYPRDPGQSVEFRHQLLQLFLILQIDFLYIPLLYCGELLLQLFLNVSPLYNVEWIRPKYPINLLLHQFVLLLPKHLPENLSHKIYQGLEKILIPVHVIVRPLLQDDHTINLCNILQFQIHLIGFTRKQFRSQPSSLTRLTFQYLLFKLQFRNLSAIVEYSNEETHKQLTLHKLIKMPRQNQIRIVLLLLHHYLITIINNLLKQGMSNLISFHYYNINSKLLSEFHLMQLLRHLLHLPSQLHYFVFQINILLLLILHPLPLLLLLNYEFCFQPTNLHLLLLNNWV